MSPKLSPHAVIDLLIAAPLSLQLRSSQRAEYVRCLRETPTCKGRKRKGPGEVKLYGKAVSVSENKLQTDGRVSAGAERMLSVSIGMNS